MKLSELFIYVNRLAFNFYKLVLNIQLDELL